jgi:hypothetical protein
MEATATRSGLIGFVIEGLVQVVGYAVLRRLFVSGGIPYQQKHENGNEQMATAACPTRVVLINYGSSFGCCNSLVVSRRQLLGYAPSSEAAAEYGRFPGASRPSNPNVSS